MKKCPSGKCSNSGKRGQFLALFLSGVQVPAIASVGPGYEGIDVFDSADQVHTVEQCGWEPPSILDYPDYYSDPPASLDAVRLAPSTFERTVDSVHRIVNRFHVVRRSDGSGGVDENLIPAMMRDLNYAYRDTPFVFVQEPGVLYVDNDEYYVDFPTFFSAYPMISAHEQAGIMNWFVTPRIRGQVAGTWIGPASQFRAILMAYDTIGSPAHMRLSPHEMAHIFQVHHPFETVFGLECTSGSNCAAAGDLVCDTPASPQLGGGNVTATGVYYGSPTGPCPGDPPYNPDTGLYMLGGWAAGSILSDHFSQGEMDRAVKFLRPNVPLSVFDLVGPDRPDILVDCDANGADDVHEILDGDKADVNRDLEPDICQVFARPGDLVVSGMNGDSNNRLRYYDRKSGDWRGDLWNGMNFIHQLRLGPDGLVYFPTLTIIDRVSLETGRTVDNFIDGVLDGAGAFVDLLFEPSGNILVLDNVKSNVRRYNGASGQSMGIFINIQVGASLAPKYMEFGPDGHIYIVGNGPAGNAIWRYDAATGQALGAFVAPGSGGLVTGQGLVFHSDGFLYVSNGAANNVLRFDANTGAFDQAFVTTAGNGGLNNPHSLRFGPDGALYVASRNTHSVKRYDGETGGYLGDFVEPGSGGSPGMGGLNQPAGLLFVHPEDYPGGPDINPGMNGAWADAATPGQGVFLDVLAEQDLLFLGWFTYETDQGFVPDPTEIHRWMVGLGPIKGNTASLKLLAVTGGTFNGPDAVTETPAGTATITFRSCTEAIFDYQLNPGLSRQVPLARVFPDSLCDALSETGQ